MDDNSGNPSDKRNWRERLGIGKTSSAADMPKLSSDFKPVTVDPDKPIQVSGSADKPLSHKPTPFAPGKVAPMAPRAAIKPITKVPGVLPPAGAKPGTVPPSPPTPAPIRTAGPRTPPLATDALANKLKDQRDAAERLALQRVQAAKNKAEATLTAGGATAKPKFSFADDTASAQAARTATTTTYGASPAPTNTFSAQPIQPPRPQLGGGGFGSPPNFAPQGPSYGQQGGFQPQPFPPSYGFQQPPAYRPIDPNTGYAPPPAQPYVPQPMRQSSPPNIAQPAQRRPSVPPLGPAPEARAPSAPRAPQVTLGPPLGRSIVSDDVFEPTPVRPTGRRATANEYQQAYRDELGYEEDAPRSRVLVTLLSFIALGLLVAIAAVYGYAHYFKNQRSATANNAVPVVSAPATPTKVTPDTPNQTGQADATTKKLIYDRIEGDHEVPGGPLKSSEEAPIIQPGAAKAVMPEGQAPKATNGTDGTPLPLPPPPGGGTGQQGSLAPDDKTDVANITPAAEPSSAALSSIPTASTASPVDQTSVIPSSAQTALPLPDPPPSTTPPHTKNAVASADTLKSSTEAIVSTKPSANKPTPLAGEPSQNELPIAKVKKTDNLKKLVLGKSLGAKPLVLVPPSNFAESQQIKSAKTAPTPSTAATGGNSLYGDGGTQVAIAVPAKPVAPLALTPAPQRALIAVPQATPAESGYIAQLASFNSKIEANSEYQRLSAKHGAIISRYAPIITQAQIAGSTRYKLNLGPMATNDAASSVCSALISAGERDCVVRRQSYNAAKLGAIKIEI